MTTPEQARKVAERLTKAQRALMGALKPMPGSDDPAAPNFRGFNYNTGSRRGRLASCSALAKRGVVARRGPSTEAYERPSALLGFVWLTDFGLAVRAILQEEER